MDEQQNRALVRTANLTPSKIGTALTIQFALFTAIGAGLWYLTGRPLSQFVEPKASAILLGLALAGALSVVAYGFFKGFPRLSERFVRMQAKSYGFLGEKIGLPLIVLISIGAGVGEEALFRGGVQTLAIDYLGPAGGILLASAVFAAVHPSKPQIMAIIFAIGVLFGWVYWMTGSLVLVMVAHAVYDIFAIDYLLKEFRRLNVLSAPADEPLSQ